MRKSGSQKCRFRRSTAKTRTFHRAKSTTRQSNDSDTELEASFYNINVNSVKVSNETEKRNKLPAVQNRLFKRSHTKVSTYNIRIKDSSESCSMKNIAFDNRKFEEENLIKYLVPDLSDSTNLFAVAKILDNHSAALNKTSGEDKVQTH